MRGNLRPVCLVRRERWLGLEDPYTAYDPRRELWICFLRFHSVRGLLLAVVCLVQFWPSSSAASAQTVTEESLRHELRVHSRPLRGPGEALLLQEARTHQYFLLGELHGEVEIPKLIARLWPILWRAQYRHIAAEVSPWAATHLEQSMADDPGSAIGLWTREQAATVRRFAAPGQPVLWGCDIEEGQPDQLIRELARINSGDSNIRRMMDLVSSGYVRKQAVELLRLAQSEHPAHDVVVGDESLWESTLDTLRVEALRSDPRSRYAASETRERVMKQLFLLHSNREATGKVLLRFGRNHLHRGYDARGISTLGNLVSEWALARGESVFNVGVFAAGGQEHLAGKTFDADERKDEPTFALLAALAGREATVFDLRLLRPIVHRIPAGERTPFEVNVTYWADSYDFLLCFPTVSPLPE